MPGASPREPRPPGGPRRPGLGLRWGRNRVAPSPADRPSTKAARDHGEQSRGPAPRRTGEVPTEGSAHERRSALGERQAPTKGVSKAREDSTTEMRAGTTAVATLKGKARVTTRSAKRTCWNPLSTQDKTQQSQEQREPTRNTAPCVPPTHAATVQGETGLSRAYTGVRRGCWELSLTQPARGCS